MKKTFVSPAHIIDTVIIYTILIVATVALCICACVYDLESVVVFSIGVSIVLFIIIISVYAFISRRGLAYVLFDEEGVTSFLLGKKLVRLKWEDIRYASVEKSFNYGADRKSVYMVLSIAEIQGKNLAVSYDMYKQVVVRIDEKNHIFVKEKVKDPTVGRLLGDCFLDLNSQVAVNRYDKDRSIM